MLVNLQPFKLIGSNITNRWIPSHIFFISLKAPPHAPPMYWVKPAPPPPPSNFEEVLPTHPLLPPPFPLPLPCVLSACVKPWTFFTLLIFNFCFAQRHVGIFFKKENSIFQLWHNNSFLKPLSLEDSDWINIKVPYLKSSIYVGDS